MPYQLGTAVALGLGTQNGEEEGRKGPVPSEPQGPPPGTSFHAALEGAAAQQLEPPPAHSEDGSSDGDCHEYSGPEPEDWKNAFFINFLGNSSPRYKIFVIISLAINPFLLLLPQGQVIAGWFVLIEFLCTLAASLQAYPLQAGGLLLIEANVMGITNPHTLLHEIEVNLNVILMLIFMVAAIHFLKNLLLWMFTNLLVRIENKVALSLTFMLSSAVMSAFLDALTVTAVIISVCTGFLGVYYYVEKHSFLPLLNNRGRSEMSFELVPQQNLQPTRELTESEVDEIWANPERHNSKMPHVLGVTFNEDRSDSTLQLAVTSPGSRGSLDMVRARGSIELVRKRAGQNLDKTSSLEVVRQKSDERKSSLEIVRQSAVERKRALESTRGQAVDRSTARSQNEAEIEQPKDIEVEIDQPKGSEPDNVSNDAIVRGRDNMLKSALKSCTSKSNSKEAHFDDLEAGVAGVGISLGHAQSFRVRQLSRSNSDPDLPCSNIAERAMLSDGSFAVPKLKQVLSHRIVQPKLPPTTLESNSFHSEGDIDVAHIEQDVNQFKAFLRSIVMHSAVGTTVGGIATMVGEPQNLIVAKRMRWDFGGFIYQMLPVSLTVLPCAILVLVICEKTKRFGYGTEMPEEVRWVLADFADKEFGRMKLLDKSKLVVQILGALLLVIGLVMHFAEVGLIGLMIVVVLTSFNGVTVEHEIAHAFLESMPFVSLLVVFLGIVGLIHDQHLFEPIITFVLGLEDKSQLGVLFLVNGVLSAVSDNVFVATVFVEQLEKAFIINGTFIDPVGGKLRYDRLGTAIIAGTNLPSMFTPNGQAALLFILTSSIAPLIHLSYRKMMVMALPYGIVLSIMGCFAVLYWQWGM